MHYCRGFVPESSKGCPFLGNPIWILWVNLHNPTETKRFVGFLRQIEPIMVIALANVLIPLISQVCLRHLVTRMGSYPVLVILRKLTPIDKVILGILLPAENRPPWGHASGTIV